MYSVHVLFLLPTMCTANRPKSCMLIFGPCSSAEYFRCQGQSIAASTVAPPHSPPTSDAVCTARPHFLYFADHPVFDMVAELVSPNPSASIPLLTYLQGQNGLVVKVYGPPLDLTAPSDSQFFLRLEKLRVPQCPYKCGTNQRQWKQKPSICFRTRSSPGLRLPDAARGHVEDMDDKDDSPFDVEVGGITIRIHVSFQFYQSLAITDDVSCIQLPGYESSTTVEKVLKEQHRIDGRPAARSMQVCGRGRGPRNTSWLTSARTALHQESRRSSDKRQAG